MEQVNGRRGGGRNGTVNQQGEGEQLFVNDMCSVFGRWGGKEHPTPTEIERGMLAVIDLVRPYLASTLPAAVYLGVHEHGRLYLGAIAEGRVQMPDGEGEKAAAERIRSCVERVDLATAPAAGNA